jgi:hypothetical protein
MIDPCMPRVFAKIATWAFTIKIRGKRKERLNKLLKPRPLG